MSIAAISCDETVDFDELHSGNRRDRVASSTLRNAICTEENQFRTCNRSVTLESPENSWKVEMVSKKARNENEDRRFETNVRAKINIEFGGPESPKVSGSFSGSVQDSRGNYLETEIYRNSDGIGDISASAGHTWSSEKDK